VKEDCRDARGTRWFGDILQDCGTLFACSAVSQDSPLSRADSCDRHRSDSRDLQRGEPDSLRAAPYPAPAASRPSGMQGPMAPELPDLRHIPRIASRSHLFEAFAVYKPWQPTLTGPSEPERFDGQLVSACTSACWVWRPRWDAILIPPKTGSVELGSHPSQFVVAAPLQQRSLNCWTPDHAQYNLYTVEA